MISEIKSNSIYFKDNTKKVSQKPSIGTTLPAIATNNTTKISRTNIVNQPNTTLSASEKQKYLFLLDFLKNTPKSPNSPELTPFGQLDYLLKNGKLLAKSNHDNSTVLDNLYEIATTERAYNLDKANLITSTLDLLVNPRFVTQTFGDIPENIQKKILANLPANDPIKDDPEAMNVYTSGTCAAASIEVNMADKYPAEFARWVAKLSSKEKSLDLNVKMNSISKNPLEAINILNLLGANRTNSNLNHTKVKVDVDENAFARAHIQSKYWDKGERSVVDVLIQSAIMKLGSQNTYNSLTDIRGNNFNQSPQGLIEIEKTFVESLIKNKEITSLVYHQIDEDQNLVGYNCSMDKIAKHITDTLDSGDDVILGYVLTNETAGITSGSNYNLERDGKPNKVINGHEITITDYYKDEKGNLIFICIDTDDDSPDLVQYSADWLLPKIHHAGYPAQIVEADEKEIMKNMIA